MKKGMLPRFAAMNIWKNKSAYLPYIGVSIFGVFTYFVFNLILHNEVVMKVPRAAYVFGLMQIGLFLLGVIMVPFLYYVNSILVKRRKQELGLYTILGMEKKHIGIMMLFETLILYVLVLVCSVVLGLLFSRMLFLILINLAGLPIDISFSISITAVLNTVRFYALICAINLLVNLTQVGKANPIELMQESKKGEKEVKYTRIWTLLGILALGYGYYLAVTSRIDSTIFINFLMAVLMVVIGTHFLITSGSVVFLKKLKKNKKIYYRKENFVTISGMLYRMKKNAASLVNICIFATMSIITLVCTVSVYLGISDIQDFKYPYEVEINFYGSDFLEREEWLAEIRAMAADEGVTIEEMYDYSYIQAEVFQEGSRFLFNDKSGDYRFWEEIRFISLDDFNRMEGSAYRLGEKEVLIYSTGKNYGLQEITIGDNTYEVQEELEESVENPKAVNNHFWRHFLIVMADRETISEAAGYYQLKAEENGSSRIMLKLHTSVEKQVNLSERLYRRFAGEPGFASLNETSDERSETRSMLGGLLFIGIFYGLIFMICLVVIMYYKQITEGFEDKKNFEIMQKVGMGDSEVKGTIKRQILMVFFLPLMGAILHTVIGINMVIRLFTAIEFYNTGLMILVTAGVCIVFAVLYGICYQRTARAYYRIVRQMQ